MRKEIIQLDKSISEKIAAGEVIEGPISVIKELVENSIDSGAFSISVEIKKGGKDYLRVTDDGHGIHKDKLQLAFSRHATSKIESAEDLFNIHTLGFRGEALASISAVSKVTMTSKIADKKMAGKIVLEGGEVLENTVTGAADGTTIIVEDLFYNTPARKKFMKDDATERTKIIEFVTQMALAFPDIRFKLISDGTMFFSTKGNGERLETIWTLSSKDFANQLVPVGRFSEKIQIEAYVSKPSFTKANKKGQLFFVNGRIIDNKIIEKAVEEAYSERLAKGRFPIIYLFLNILPKLVDVNIHPNKREVKLYDDAEVQEFVKTAILQALSTDNAVTEIEVNTSYDKKNSLFRGDYINAVGKNTSTTPDKIIDREENNLAEKDSKFLNISLKNSNQYGKNDFIEEDKNYEEEINIMNELSELNDIQKQVDIKNILSNINAESQNRVREESEIDSYAANNEVDEKEEDNSGFSSAVIQTQRENSERRGFNQLEHLRKRSHPNLKSFDFKALEVKTVLFGTYIVASDEDAFYLIDQHAAHERINYEKLLKEYHKSKIFSQQIMTPIVVTRSVDVTDDELRKIEHLKELGFIAEEFGPKTYKITEIPSFMSLLEAEVFFTNYLDIAELKSLNADIEVSDFEDLSKNKFIDETALEKIAQRACKSSIKGNQHLNMDGANVLLERLAACENPFSCPHGRPTFIRQTMYDIETRFKRR
ncbi:MAG: DNA mismatch repair endonuclease MutL [Anaerovoracaceae bacterium]